jgi:hypothetical protein
MTVSPLLSLVDQPITSRGRILYLMIFFTLPFQELDGAEHDCAFTQAAWRIKRNKK